MSKQKRHVQGAASALDRLQRWYLRECNGDWEHSFGVQIETLDNPGWRVTVDLAETEWADLNVERRIVERSETDWHQYEVSQQRFIGCGGPLNLPEVLQSFFDILERP